MNPALSRLAGWLRERIAIAEDDLSFWRMFGEKGNANERDLASRIAKNKKLLKKCEEDDA